MPLFYSVFKESRQVRCAAYLQKHLRPQCSQGLPYKFETLLLPCLIRKSKWGQWKSLILSIPKQEKFKNKMTILFEVIKKCLLVVTLTLVFNAKTCLCDVIVTNKNYSSTLARFHSASASFGESLPSEGLKGVAIKSIPEDGCHEIEPPPSTPQNM